MHPNNSQDLHRTLNTEHTSGVKPVNAGEISNNAKNEPLQDVGVKRPYYNDVDFLSNCL